MNQRYPYHFNKAALMNVGYLVARTMYHPDCLLFHDVDLLMENDRNIAVCTPNKALHMGAFVSKFSYKLVNNTHKTFRMRAFVSKLYYKLVNNRHSKAFRMGTFVSKLFYKLV